MPNAAPPELMRLQTSPISSFPPLYCTTILPSVRIYVGQTISEMKSAGGPARAVLGQDFRSYLKLFYCVECYFTRVPP